MTNGATANEGSADKLPLADRGTLLLFAGIAAMWCVVSWFFVNWLVQERTTELVTQETAQAQKDVSGISENFERVLDRLQGLPAVLAHGSDVASPLATFGPSVSRSAIAPAAQKEAWTHRPDLLVLNRHLLAITGEIDVDVIWVMNASGDCVAASNFGEAVSFIGTNHADRAYFKSAQEGKRGRQYAMGRVTNVPGLFFSAPVLADGRFLGTVAVKIDLPRLAPWVNRPYAFVTDEYGVVILAADRGQEMRVLPGATVGRLPAEQRQASYKREASETLAMEPDPQWKGVVRVAGSPHPHAAAHSERPQQGIAVHILAPIAEIQSMRGDAFAAFLLLSFSGIALAALIFGARAYVLRVRQHRLSVEATNVSLNRLNEHLDRLARIDPLTECANRRHFQACLQAEVARSGRYAHVCSLLVIDLDHFKEVNDRFGHAGGDQALRHFVQIARQQLRSQDVLGRLGGEEFAVLLPETGEESGIAVAERIRQAVEESPARYGDAWIPMTASFGLACWSPPGESADALLQRADKALYAAKAAGRNRVAVGDRNAERESRTVESAR